MEVPVTPEWAAQSLDPYLARLTNQRGLSPHTTEAYRRDLAQFFAYCDRGGVGSVDAVDRRVARHYLAYLDTLGYSRTTIARKASSVRAFYTDAVVRGAAPANPFDGVSTPKLGRPLPHAIPAHSMTAAIESIDTTGPRGLRDRAIIEMLYATGLRVSELASLTTGPPVRTLWWSAGRGERCAWSLWAVPPNAPWTTTCSAVARRSPVPTPAGRCGSGSGAGRWALEACDAPSHGISPRSPMR